MCIFFRENPEMILSTGDDKRYLVVCSVGDKKKILKEGGKWKRWERGCCQF